MATQGNHQPITPVSVLLQRFQGRGLGNHTTGRKMMKRCGLHVLSLLGVLEPHILRNYPSRAASVTQHHRHCAVPPFSKSRVAVGCVSKDMIIPAATKSVQKLPQRSGPPSEGLVRLPLLSCSQLSPENQPPLGRAIPRHANPLTPLSIKCDEFKLMFRRLRDGLRVILHHKSHLG